MDGGSSEQRKRYLVRQIRGRWLLLLFAPILLVPLLSFPSIVPQAWLAPLMFAFSGIVIAISAVQSWLRQTRSFWIALLIIFFVDLLAGHLFKLPLSPQSRGDLKGVAFLVILAGYAVGIPVFLLLEKVLPTREPR